MARWSQKLDFLSAKGSWHLVTAFFVKIVTTIMDKIEHIRSHSIYPHRTCAKQCAERGDTIRIMILHVNY